MKFSHSVRDAHLVQWCRGVQRRQWLDCCSSVPWLFPAGRKCVNHLLLCLWVSWQEEKVHTFCVSAALLPCWLIWLRHRAPNIFLSLCLSITFSSGGSGRNWEHHDLTWSWYSPHSPGSLVSVPRFHTFGPIKCTYSVSRESPRPRRLKRGAD